MIRPVRFQLRNAGKTGRVVPLTPYPLRTTSYLPIAAQPVPPTPVFPPYISDAILWLDGADSSNIFESGGFVTQWNDKSQSALIATFVNSSTYDVGRGEITTSPMYDSYFSVPLDVSQTEQPQMSIFMVYSWPGYLSGLNQVLWGNDIINNSARGQVLTYPVFPAADYALLTGYNPPAFPFINVTGLDNSVRHLYNINCDLNVVNGSTFYLDTVLNSTYTESPEDNIAIPNSTLYFGAGTVNAGFANSYASFNEILIYNRNLNNTERQNVEAYLYAKWNL
jgi:hypothetical protein